MSNLILPRRRFLTGLATLFAAPAIVRAASLMPVKAIDPRVAAIEADLVAMRLRWEAFIAWFDLKPEPVAWFSPSDKARIDVAVQTRHWSFANLAPEGDPSRIFPSDWTWRAIERKLPNPLEHRA